MGSELSDACFNDVCDQCGWGGCGCNCHEWQIYDLVNGWILDEEALEP